MRRPLVTLVLVLVPPAAALAGVQAIRLWLSPRDEGLTVRKAKYLTYNWGEDFNKHTPTQVNTGTLIRGSGLPSDDPGSWPCFRGADGSNIAPPEEKLLRNWTESGPDVLWELGVGEGHAGVAVRGGRVYIIDYDREKKEDAVRCLSLADGKEIWRYAYYVSVKRNHGMSRTVPAVTDDYVVTLGPKGPSGGE